ncbi:MAG TPA: PEP-CTERM sorting domain-containing protein [Tepidisphaeraceae bacterium]|jgi:hypothetical protein|nr:PEP-CTERM sorting domain-containing protein [Tepidisphaeraceae bacterium]
MSMGKSLWQSAWSDRRSNRLLLAASAAAIPLVIGVAGEAARADIVPANWYGATPTPVESFSTSTNGDSGGHVAVPTPVGANGLTLAVQMTPSTADITNSEQSLPGETGVGAPVNLLEIGGTTTGSGLLIVNGQYWFDTHTGVSSAYPTSSPDYSSQVAVDLGAAVGGAQATLYVSLDYTDNDVIVGYNGTQTVYSLPNGTTLPTNWYGGLTMSFAGQDSSSGNMGGEDSGALDHDPFTAADNVAYVGTPSTPLEGEYFNAYITPAPTPEPASGLALLVGTGALLIRRHRRA